MAARAGAAPARPVRDVDARAWAAASVCLARAARIACRDQSRDRVRPRPAGRQRRSVRQDQSVHAALHAIVAAGPASHRAAVGPRLRAGFARGATAPGRCARRAPARRLRLVGLPRPPDGAPVAGVLGTHRPRPVRDVRVRHPRARLAARSAGASSRRSITSPMSVPCRSAISFGGSPTIGSRSCIDLNGYTTHARKAIFAHRPARCR